MFGKDSESGVSPVIGVILMVAVTVALVALVTVIVFDIGGDVSDSPDATVQLEEVSDGVQATILRNENVEGFSLEVDGESADDDTDSDGFEDAEAGSTAFYDEAGELEPEDTVVVVAEMPDGSEEVLTTTDYEG